MNIMSFLIKANFVDPFVGLDKTELNFSINVSPDDVVANLTGIYTHFFVFFFSNTNFRQTECFKRLRYLS